MNHILHAPPDHGNPADAAEIWDDTLAAVRENARGSGGMWLAKRTVRRLLTEVDELREHRDALNAALGGRRVGG